MTVVDRQQTIAVTDPTTGDVIGEIDVTTPEQIADMVERARAAQMAWGALTPRDRGLLLSRWRDLLWERQEEAIRILRRENGKTDASAFIELAAADNVAQYMIYQAPRVLKPERRPALIPLIQRAKLHHKPVGIVGIITPWNYPAALPLMDIVPALLAGNSVILKPSELTPYIADFVISLMHDAGIPHDVVQIAHGDGTTGAALVEYVDYVQFTGSVEVGKKVGKRCVERLIPFSLELGGKDPCIVLNDAQVDLAAAGVMAGAFENAGQMCISVERVYVEAGIYDTFLQRIRHHMQDLIIGAGDGEHTVMGSMTQEETLKRTEAHIADAVAKGAVVIYGGNRRPDLGPLFFEPTILVNCDHTMDIMHAETFGPVLPIMKVKNADEAITLANDSIYGLSASIYTSDLARGEALGLQLDTGDVSINRPQFVTGTPSLPMGGERNSGLGRRGGPEGLLKYTRSQSMVIDTLIGTEASLIIGNPTVKAAARLMRQIRRWLPFV